MTVGNIRVDYTYDALGRQTAQTLYDVNGTALTERVKETYTYKSLANGAATSYINRVQLEFNESGYESLSYSYDDCGRVSEYYLGAWPAQYTYDSAGQLIRENSRALSTFRSMTWTYDNAGNITSKSIYAYSMGDLGTPTKTINYSYTNSEWGDLLTGYDGRTITYDEVGNPLSDGIWTYTWQHGRQLASMSSGGTTWTYTYNNAGLRTKRTNGSTTYTYVYNGSQLVAMTKGTDTLYFTYDADGNPLTVTYNGATYYYITNPQGDVVFITDSQNGIVVYYAYDAWGTAGKLTGTLASTLGAINPLRYRGYVYDTETGLYYLQSRYYNPEWGRFINADEFVSTGQGVLSNNMFMYCLNNPVNMVDASGKNTEAVDWWISTMWWLLGADGLLPVGDAVYIAGIIVLGGNILISLTETTTPQVSLEEEKKTVDPEPPDVTYPGDDPTKAPEGTVWKGKGEQGSKQGNYHNPETGESWHQDLDHPEPIGPHWDYRDPFGIWWRIGPGDTISLK